MKGKPPRLNCGWNLTAEKRFKIADFLKGFKPRDAIGKRDKKILLLAFKHDMNAAQIARLGDSEIVRYNKNRESTGKPLSAKGILNAIYERLPFLRRARGYSVTTKNHQKRAELTAGRRAELAANKPKICAICGSVEELRLHHIVPVAYGGTNDMVNLIFLCDSCHNELHARIYKTWENAQ